MKGLPIWMKSELASLATAVSGSSRKWRKQSYHVQDAQQHQKQQRKLLQQQRENNNGLNKPQSIAADHIVLTNNDNNNTNNNQSTEAPPVAVMNNAVATRSAPVFAWAEDSEQQRQNNNSHTVAKNETNYGAQLAADCAELVVNNSIASTINHKHFQNDTTKLDDGQFHPPQSSSGTSSATRSLTRTANNNTTSHNRRRAPLIVPNNNSAVDAQQLQTDDDLDSPLLPSVPLPVGLLPNENESNLEPLRTLNPVWNYEVASSASRRLQNQIDQLSEMLAAVDVDQQQQQLFNLTMLPDPTHCSGSILNGYVFAKKPPEAQEQAEIVQSPVLPDATGKSEAPARQQQVVEEDDDKTLQASLADPNLLFDSWPSPYVENNETFHTESDTDHVQSIPTENNSSLGRRTKPKTTPWENPNDSGRTQKHTTNENQTESAEEFHCNSQPDVVAELPAVEVQSAVAPTPPPLPEKLRPSQASRLRLRGGNTAAHLLLLNSPRLSTSSNSGGFAAAPVSPPAPDSGKTDTIRRASAATRRLPTPPDSTSTAMSSPEQFQQDRRSEFVTVTAFPQVIPPNVTTSHQLSDEPTSASSDNGETSEAAPLRVAQHRHLIKHFEALATKGGSSGGGGGGGIQSDESEQSDIRPYSIHQDIAGVGATSSTAHSLELPAVHPKPNRKSTHHANTNNIGRSSSLHEVRLSTSLSCAKPTGLDHTKKPQFHSNVQQDFRQHVDANETSNPADRTEEQILSSTKPISSSQQRLPTSTLAIRPTSLFVPTAKPSPKPQSSSSDLHGTAWKQLQQLLQERRTIIEMELELNPSSSATKPAVTADSSIKPKPSKVVGSKNSLVFDENFYKSRDIQRYLTATESFRQNYLQRRRRLLMREHLQHEPQNDRRNSTLPKTDKGSERKDVEHNYDEADDAAAYITPAANANSVKRRKSKSGAKTYHHHHSHSHLPQKSSMTSLLACDNDSYYNGSNASASLQRRHSRHNERIGKTLERRCERLEKSVFTLTRSLAYVSAQLHQQSVQLRSVHTTIRGSGGPIGQQQLQTNTAAAATTAATSSGAMLTRPATMQIHHHSAAAPTSVNAMVPITVHALPAHIVHAAAAAQHHQQQQQQQQLYSAAAQTYTATAAKPVRRAHQPQPQAPQQLVPPANITAPQGCRTQVTKSTNITTATTNNQNVSRPERKLAERVTRLTRFFGTEPPLLQNFLKRLGYEKYYSLFEAEAIGMAELPYMTDERLRIMGIPLGPRARILREAQNPIELTPNVSMYIV